MHSFIKAASNGYTTDKKNTISKIHHINPEM
jgi:hypothetical protein